MQGRLVGAPLTDRRKPPAHARRPCGVVDGAGQRDAVGLQLAEPPQQQHGVVARELAAVRLLQQDGQALAHDVVVEAPEAQVQQLPVDARGPGLVAAAVALLHRLLVPVALLDPPSQAGQQVVFPGALLFGRVRLLLPVHTGADGGEGEVVEQVPPEAGGEGDGREGVVNPLEADQRLADVAQAPGAAPLEGEDQVVRVLFEEGRIRRVHGVIRADDGGGGLLVIGVHAAGVADDALPERGEFPGGHSALVRQQDGLDVQALRQAVDVAGQRGECERGPVQVVEDEDQPFIPSRETDGALDLHQVQQADGDGDFEV